MPQTHVNNLHEITDQGLAVIAPDDLVVPATESLVIDLGAYSGFVPWFASGTHTRQPCDASGTALPGSSSANLTAGTEVRRSSRYTKVTAGAVDLTICRI